MLAGSSDGTIWMWLVAQEQCLQVFAGHDGKVSSGLFTNDGKFVCSGGDDGTVRIWAPKTGVCKQVFDEHTAHKGPVTCLDNSLDGDLLLSGSVDGSVRLYKISTKKLLMSFLHSNPLTVKNEEDNNSNNNINKVKKEDLVSGDIDDLEDEVVKEVEFESYTSVECVGFSHGEFQWIASGGMDKTLKVWDMMSGNCRCVCLHNDSVVALKWHMYPQPGSSSSLPLVATACLDHLVRLWDARGGDCLLIFTGHTNLVTNLDMVVHSKDEAGDRTHNNDMIVSVSDDGTAKLFHFNSERIMNLK